MMAMGEYRVRNPLWKACKVVTGKVDKRGRVMVEFLSGRKMWVSPDKFDLT